MLCQKCKQNNASSHIHYVRNGVVRDMYLCDTCANELKKENSFDNDFFKMLSTLFNNNYDLQGETNKVLKCDCCNTTFSEIRRTGKIGCANCYKVFEGQLLPIISRIHSNNVHTGKSVESVGDNPTDFAETDVDAVDEKQQQIDRLKLELSDAIKNEEYEKAAVLRDEIRSLEE